MPPMIKNIIIHDVPPLLAGTGGLVTGVVAAVLTGGVTGLTGSTRGVGLTGSTRGVGFTGVGRLLLVVTSCKAACAAAMICC